MNEEAELLHLTGINSDEATERIGQIGLWNEKFAGKALDILAKREGDIAFLKISEIGLRHESAASQALDIISGHEGDKATFQIGRIGSMYESAAAQALDLLAQYEGADRILRVGEVGHAYMSAAPQALEILADCPEDMASLWINLIVQQYDDEDIAAQALDIASRRDGTSAAMAIGMAGINNKSLAGKALEALTVREENDAMAGGVVHYITQIGMRHPEFTDQVKEALLYRATRNMNDGDTLSNSYNKVVPLDEVMEHVLDYGDNFEDDGVTLGEYTSLRETSIALASEISQPERVQAMLDGQTTPDQENQLRTLFTRIEQASLLYGHFFMPPTPLSDIVDEIKKGTASSEKRAVEIHDEAFPAQAHLLS